MPYTQDSVHHGSVRFATLPIDQWTLHLIPWNGGGLVLRDPITEQWRMHKIPWPSLDDPQVVDIRDCSVEGVPHQALEYGPVYCVYAKDDGMGNISIDFSQTRENVFDGYIIKQGENGHHWMAIGHVGALPYGGGIGFSGGPTCAMCASFFQPEQMCLVSPVGGESRTPGEWVELLPFQKQLNFVCYGDGRECSVRFVGMVGNEAAAYNTFVGISRRDVDPAWDDISGGTSHAANEIVPAVCELPGAGWGDGAELYQRFGLKMRVEGGKGTVFGGKLIAKVWM